MSHSKTLVGIIVLGMSLGASGCATKSFSMAKFCTEMGGTWDAAKHACNGRAAKTVCESAIGSYNMQSQTCEF